MPTSGKSFRQEMQHRIFREPRSGYGWPWDGVYLACVGVLGSVFGSAFIACSLLTPYFSWPSVFFGLTLVLWTAPELLPKSGRRLAGAMRIGAFVCGFLAIALGFIVLLITLSS